MARKNAAPPDLSKMPLEIRFEAGRAVPFIARREDPQTPWYNIARLAADDLEREPTYAGKAMWSLASHLLLNRQAPWGSDHKEFDSACGVLEKRITDLLSEGG